MSSIHEIRVTPKPGFDDPRAANVHHEVQQLGHEVDEIASADVYHVEGVSREDALKLAALVTDPVTQDVSLEERTDWENPQKLEVAPLPGVMNPATLEIMDAAKTAGIAPDAVQTGVEYRFGAGATEATLGAVTQLLVNNSVEQVRTKRPDTLTVKAMPEGVQLIDVAAQTDEELAELSKGRKLALNVAEMKAIRDHAQEIGRELTDVELEYLAAAWSEHCGHKTFNAELLNKETGEIEKPLFKRIKDGSTLYFREREVISAFHDNSGVFRFYDGQAIGIKLETHNSPMNLEPYGGSATGSGGVFRDIVATGKGARVINSQHIQFLAPLDLPQADVPPGCHTPRYLIRRSVAGVSDYGNRMGIPTNDVSFHSHRNYRGKGSILVGAMGIMPEENAQKGEPQAGDLVIAAGGRTGKDGLHGATFSSETADGDTANLHAGAVQIGNPIEEKKVFDAILEASDKGLIKAMTDCGAAGFASAVGEIGEDIGVSIDLANAPLKYDGLSPWEIFVSESQERMVLAVDAAHWEELEQIFAKHGSEAAVLGTFGSPEGEDPSLHVTYKGDTVVHLDYDFIKNGLPDQGLEAEWTPSEIKETEPVSTTFRTALMNVMANGNVCSTEPITRQYDHEVQGTNALKPYGGVNGDGRNEAVVLTPILGQPYAVIEAHGTNPTIADIDPSKGSTWSFVEAMSNFVAVGGNPDDAVLVNNYITATPTPRVLGALSQSVDALMECVAEFRAPIISGKDSLSSTFKMPDGELLESPYNLTVTVAGKIPDVVKTVSSDIKKTGSTLVLVGKQDLEAMGGSVYYEEMGGASAQVPDIDIEEFHRTAKGVHAAIQTGKVLSAKGVNEGGVAAAVAQMAIGGDNGASLDYFGLSNDQLNKRLFNETAGCFIVEVDTPETAKELFGDNEYVVLGKTTEERALTIRLSEKSPEFNSRIPISIEDIKKAWKQPFEEVFA